MKDVKIMEIELGKLEPNKYNPRKRMTKKYLESLKESLKTDGQLQTVLVRPIKDGKYEVVAGMRRYYCLKDLYNKNEKVVCTVQDMDDKTAMLKSYKENVEREQLNPIDEAGWFFKMLALHKEQLYMPQTESVTSGEPPLPSHGHPEVIKLAKELGTTPTIIEHRLPLLALPEELQELTIKTFFEEIDEKDARLVTTTAEVIARLRLMGDKEESQEQMMTIWKKWGKEDASVINEYVSKILEAYKESDEILEKELKTLEKSLDKRIGEMSTWIEGDIANWLKPDSSNSILKELPKELIESDDGIEIPAFRSRKKDEKYRDYADEIYNGMDNFVMGLTKNTLLDDCNDDFEVKREKLITGKKELEEESCVYCGSHVNEDHIQKRIEDILDKVHDIQKKIKDKDKVRNKAEKMKRELGTLIKKFDEVASSYIASLDKLLKTNKIKKEDYQERLDKYNLG